MSENEITEKLTSINGELMELNKNLKDISQLLAKIADIEFENKERNEEIIKTALREYNKIKYELSSRGINL